MEKSEEEKGFCFCDEIEEEIMLRLPTKSLSRFNCVSKTWYDRINNSSQFARNHLKRQRQSSQSNNNFYLMLHSSREPLQSISCSSNHCDNNAEKIQHHQPLLVDLNDEEFNVLGSCDGLLLVVATSGGVDDSQVIYVWNPTTGEYKTLPQLSYSMKRNIVFGFGPDLTNTTDNNNHYKVLLLDTVSEKVEFKVNMYTTQTNSWKTLLPNAPFCYSTPLHQGMILFNDNLHFLAEIDAIEEDPILHMSIISFDLKDDKFRVLPMSPGTTLLHQVCALDGNLCAFSNTDDVYDYYCIWRMNNFGVKKEECWTKICSIDSCLAMDKPIDLISPLHVLEDGQILLYAQLKGQQPGNPFIVSYNIENNKASFFVQGNVLYPVVYEESFISPKAASTDEEELPRQLKCRRTYIE